MRKISSLSLVLLSALSFLAPIFTASLTEAHRLPPFDSESATVGTPGTAAGTAPASETQPTTPPMFRKIYDKPLDLTVVQQDLVCGTTRDEEKKTICVGDMTSNTIIEPLGKVSELFGNRLATCARDEKGLHCWKTSSKFEKPMTELAGKAIARDIRFSYSRLCVAQADQTILCHSAEQERWSSELGRYIKYYPAPESIGPFHSMKDFDVTDREICWIDGDSVGCRFFADVPTTEQNASVAVPKRHLKNPKELAIDYSTFCVTDDIGVVCSKGIENAKEIEFGVEWLGASDLTVSYETICGRSGSNQPLCAKFNLTSGQPTDSLPNSLKSVIQNPGTTVVDFKAYGERICLKLRSQGSATTVFRCWMNGFEERVPPNLGDVADFVVGGHVCAVAENGWISCFGNGRFEASPLPSAPDAPNYYKNCGWNSLRVVCEGEEVDSALSNIRTVLAVNQTPSVYNTCLLVEDANGAIDVRCSGSEMSGIVAQRPVFTSNPIGLSLTHTYGCIYGEDDIQCWGDPLGSQPAPNLSAVKKLILGASVGCALDKFGFICWGDLQSAGLEVPTSFGEPETVTDFTMGQRHVCVLTVDQRVSCWGGNEYGQTDVPTLNKPDQIKSAEFVTCASSSDGVTCWGLGQSTLGNSPENMTGSP